MNQIALKLPGFNTQTGFTTVNSIGGSGGAFHLTDSSSLGEVLSGTLEVVFYIAGFLLFFWMLWGVFKYLLAEGDKEHLVKARNHLRWALVGFIVVILAFLLSQYAQKIIPQVQVPLTNLTK